MQRRKAQLKHKKSIQGTRRHLQGVADARPPPAWQQLGEFPLLPRALPLLRLREQASERVKLYLHVVCVCAVCSQTQLHGNAAYTGKIRAI